MIKTVAWVKKRPILKKTIMILNQLITTITYIMYPLMIIKLYVADNPIIYVFVILPLVMFLLVSIFRNFYEAKRPYEIYEYESIINKKSLGKSFPSRHVFSIFVIAMSFFNINAYMGALFLIMGMILAVCRVLGGVHFPKDVIVGALLGIVPWLIFWAL